MAVLSADDLGRLQSGINQVLAHLNQQITGTVLSDNLPLLGAQLAQSQVSGAQATRDALNAVGLLGQTVQTALAALTDPDGASLEDIQSAIDSALAASPFSGSSVTLAETASGYEASFAVGRGAGFSQAIDGNYGLPGLAIATEGTAAVTLDYALAFTVGLDAAAGDEFYLRTDNESLNLGLTASGANLSADAQIGFVNMNATDLGSFVDGSFAMTLTDADGKLRLSEMGAGGYFGASFTGTSDIRVRLDADMGTSVLPSMGATLNVDWDFVAATVNPATPSFGNLPSVRFTDVTMDFGSFVQDYLLPLLEQIDAILQPVSQAMAVFRTDLSFLKLIPGWETLLDVAGSTDQGQEVGDAKITLLDFLKLALPDANLGPLVTFFEIVDNVSDLVGSLRGRSLDTEAYNLGAFDLLVDLRDVANELGSGTPNVVTAAGNLSSFVENLASGDYLTIVDAPSGRTIKDEITDILMSTHYAFPILEDPSTAFGFLLGQPVDLFTLDLPVITLGGGFDANGNPSGALVDLFPPVPLFPFVNLKLQGAFQLAMDLSFGFDTRGLTQYVDSGFSDTTAIINGLFISDVNTAGVDVAEFSIALAAQLGIEADFLGLSAGGAGNVVGQIFLNLVDTIGGSPADGKVYYDELATALATSPFSLFDASGRISAGLTAYAKWLGVDFWRVNTPRFTVGDFDFSVASQAIPSGPPPGLGDATGATLDLNIGLRASERDIADTIDGSEQFVLTRQGGLLRVSAFGFTETFSGITQINGHGGAMDDSIQFAESNNIKANLTGGAGNDLLAGGSGADTLSGGDGFDYLLGRTGADSISGGADDDLIDGGAGRDTIDGGGGIDTLTYEQSVGAVVVNLATGVFSGGDALSDVVTNVEIFEGSRNVANGDVMTGAAGNDIFLGLQGDDTLNGQGGDDILIGGAGVDRLDGGDGYDHAYYLGATGGVVLSLLTGGTGGEAAGDTFIGIEQVEGSNFSDAITGASTADALFGYAGNDALAGAEGADYLEGGIGADSLIGDEGIDTAGYLNAMGGIALSLATGGTVGEAAGDRFTGIERVQGSRLADTIGGDALNNELLGDAGDDVLDGAGGADSLLGGAGNDTLRGGNGDDTLIGNTGADALEGGSGRDTAFYQASAVRVLVTLGAGPASGGDADGDTYMGVENVTGSDLSTAGDQLTGDVIANLLSGLAGSDTLNGADGDDTLIGGSGNDSLAGGTGIDELSYATSTTAVIVNLGATARTVGAVTVAGGTARDGLGGTDMVDGIEQIRGSAFADRMFATDSGTFFVGGAGSDTFVGGAGVDRVSYFDAGAAVSVDLASGIATDGSGGTDRTSFIEQAEGSAFNDTLYGSSGSQLLLGGNGADLLDGRGGSDTMDGQNGDDTYFVDNAGDQVNESGTGRDLVVAALSFSLVPTALVEDLTLVGTALEATGNAQANRIIGNTLDNRIDGRGSADDMRGGAGNDTYVFDTLADRVVELADEGTDLIELQTEGLAFAVEFSLDQGWAQDVENVTVLDSFYRVDLVGNNCNNVLIGNALTNAISGNDGNDRLVFTGGGRDTAVGGADNDTLVVNWFGLAYAQYSTAVPTGSLAGGYGGRLQNQYDEYSIDFTGIENFEITLGDGSDAITAGDGNDVLRGNAGNDTLATGMGIDIVDGGAGTDRWVADKSFLTAQQAMVLNLRAAEQQASYAGAGSVSGIEAVTLQTGAGNDAITTLRLENLADTVTTGLGDDTVSIGNGQDVVDVGGGTDTLILDWADLGYSQHSVGAFSGSIGAGYAGRYENQYNEYGVNFAGVERFWLTLGAGNDVVTTGDHNDTVLGNAGNDTLTTGQGIDIVDGGTGDDRWVADKSFMIAGQAMVLDLSLAGGQASYAGTGTVAGFEMLTLQTGAGHDVIRTLVGPGHADTLVTGAGNDTVLVGGGHDSAAMGDGFDTLTLDWQVQGYSQSTVGDFLGTLGAGYSGRLQNQYNEYSVTFSGVERFSLLLGGSNDSVVTGDGNDTVTGNAGNDTLATGMGIDIVDGGAGTDRWVADKSFLTAQRAMVLDLSLEGLQATYFGGGTVSGIEAVTLKTGAGNDQITTRIAEAHNDVIDTGARNDIVTVGHGHDTVDMGNGTDTLRIDWTTLAYGQFLSVALTGNLASGYAGRFQNQYNEYGVTFTGVESFDIRGGADNDSFATGDGKDTLDGGAGSDVLQGGGGADTYYSDGSDTIIEAANAGRDIVYTTGSLTLDANVENLTLLGLADINATGNIQSNRISGNDGNNLLDGGLGSDTMIGGAGNDIYIVNSGGDRVFETTTTASTIDAGGADTVQSAVTFSLAASAGLRFVETLVLTGSATIDGTGNALANLLIGNAGKNLLNGGLGDDTMLGGAGNDTYVVNTTGDQVFETTTPESPIDAGGTDTVESAVTFSLDATDGVRCVERLTLTGGGHLDATGNALANLLTGNAGRNLLDGGLGNDILLGGAGNDTYIVNATGDRVYETTTIDSLIDAGGTDTVQSAATFSLDANVGVRFVELLTLTGAANLDGTGNALANTLVGNTGNNVLNGGLGNDTMTGDVGADIFLFNTVLGVGNFDRISDFDVVDDTIRLDDAIFAGLATGTLATKVFAGNLTGQAVTESERIIYETDTGRLFFDRDGVGGVARVQFATVSEGLMLTNQDFFVF